MPDDCDPDGWKHLQPRGHDFLSVLHLLQQRDKVIVTTSLERIACSRDLLARLQIVRPQAQY